MEKIVVGSDGSASALNATSFTATLAKAMGAEVVVVNSFDIGAAVAFLSPEAMDSSELIIEAGTAGQNAVLSRTTEILKNQEVSFRTVADLSNAVDSLIRVATEEQASLLVIGSHELSGFEETLFGTVTDSVIHRSPCPVLVTHGTPKPIRRILVGVDGTETGDDALRAAGKLAQSLNAVVVVFHLLDSHSPYPGIDPSETDAAGYALLVGKALTEHVTEILSETNVTFEIRQEVGEIRAAILSAISTQNIDLVALGCHSPNPIQRLLHQSASYEILHHASCPVLISPSSGLPTPPTP